ncbi:MAG: hypothetical protein KJ042_10310 [Deltaproteobacteria bacterium]|nr:hypothetical protein [Deltaproteobacteria bacterium]
MSTSPILNFDQLTGYTGPEEKKKTDMLDKEVFLNLLMTQMKQQDPLDPMDNQQFLDQLASLATVEELRTSNSNLATLQLYQSSINNAQSVSMIGKDVRAKGDSIHLAHDGDTTKVHFLLASEAKSAEITVYNSKGTVVRTFTASDLDEGINRINFNGLDRNGSPLLAGDYTFEVKANGADGATVNATTLISGRVEGVSFDNGGPELMIDGHKVMIGDVYEVAE